jgi:hypothetical protein
MSTRGVRNELEQVVADLAARLERVEDEREDDG